MNISRVLIVGNGIAGTTAAFTLREAGFAGQITLVGEEPWAAYYRPRLPEILDEDVPLEKLMVVDAKKYEARQITLKTGTRIVRVDPETHLAIASDNESFPYDALVLATGCKANIPPIPGADFLKGIFSLRTLQDAKQIKEWAKGKKHAVCLGGGLLGLENAYHLTQLGLTVDIIETMGRLLPRQLDARSAPILQAALEKKGMRFHLGCNASRFLGKDGVATTLEVEGRGPFPADLFIITVGILPRRDLIDSLGGKCERGVIINENGQTSVPGIYAAGDHVQYKTQTWGTWLAARHWGIRVGQVLAGTAPDFALPPEIFRLKVTGIDLLSVGNTDLEGQTEALGNSRSHVVNESPEMGQYLKFVEEKGTVIGAVLLGLPEKAREVEAAVKSRKPWS